MTKRINMIGEVYGNLTIKEYEGAGKKGAKWLANCSCGKSISVTRHKLMKGKKSCGCLASPAKYQNLFNKVKKLNSPGNRGFVYIANYLGILYKIGYTNDLERRFGQLAYEFQGDISLSCYVEVNGASTLENALHIKYSESQVPVMYKHGNSFSREFFRIDLQLIIKDFEELGLKVIHD